MNSSEKINNMTKDGTDDLPSDNIKALEYRYNQILGEVANAKDNLVYLRKKEEVLPYSNYNKINIMFWIVKVITFLTLVSLISNLLITLDLGVKLSLFFINVTSMLVCIPFVGVVDVLLFKKVRKVLQRKSYERIINSLEYKQLVKDIRDAVSVLDEKLILEGKITKELLEFKSKSAIESAEKNIRDILINYNSSDIDENTTYGGNEKLRTNTRKLIRNRNSRNIK